MAQQTSRSGKWIDVKAQRRVKALPQGVAAVMFEPSREPEWMKAVKEAGRDNELVGTGARAWQKGRFLGKEIHWTTEVTDYQPERRLAMSIRGGPFRGCVTYTIEAIDRDSIVTIRNEGEPTAFRWLPRRLTEAAMSAAMAKDLARLAALVEHSERSMDRSVAE